MSGKKTDYWALAADDLVSEKKKAELFAEAQKDPLLWAKKVLGIKQFWPGQEQILRDFPKYNKFTIASGHGMGKDFLGATIALYFLYCFPPATVITTATSERQVSKVMWGELAKQWSQAKFPLGGRLLTRDLIIDEKDKWFATGFTTKETNEVVGKFQGFHNDNVLIVVSEAQAVDDIIFEEIDSLLVGENCKLVLLGNPLAAQGAFYKSFQDPTFRKYKFSCYESPNFTAKKEVIPGMVSYRWVKEKEQAWGLESPLFQSRVLGEFPKTSLNSLISLSELRESLETVEPMKGWKVLSVDPARYGLDETAICLVEGGKVTLMESHSGKATTETTGRIVALIKKYHPDYVVIDEGAMGAGIVDQIEEQAPILKIQGHAFDLYPFAFGAKPTDGHFANMGTEAYFRCCGAITDKKVRLIEDDDLFSQLSSRRYKFNSKGKMMLESKEDLKSRGVPSPDKADALVMALSLSLDSDYMETIARKNDEDYDEKKEKKVVFDKDPITGYRRIVI